MLFVFSGHWCLLRCESKYDLRCCFDSGPMIERKEGEIQPVVVIATMMYAALEESVLAAYLLV
jgi:hypothetical protein